MCRYSRDPNVLISHKSSEYEPRSSQELDVADSFDTVCDPFDGVAMDMNNMNIDDSNPHNTC